MDRTIVTELERLAKEKPDKPAFIFVDKHYKRTVFSRQEIWDLSRKFAAILRRKGINRGDVVCNTLPNSPERLLTQLGAVLAGAIDMNGQTCLADGADFLLSLNQGQSKAIILDPTDERGAAKILQPKLDTDISVGGKAFSPDIPSLEMIIPCVFQGQTTREKTLLQQIVNESELVKTDIAPAEECAYMGTSGSTGFFKLVTFNSNNLLEFAMAFGKVNGVTEDSTYCNDKPFGWLGGYPVVYAAFGCTRVVVDCTLGQPDNYADFLWEIIDREKCTAAHAGPLLLETLTNVATRRPHPSGHMLKECGCGGGPLTMRHMEAIGKVTQRINVVYGSSEGGVIDKWEISNPSEFENLGCGWPTSGSEIKIVDTDLQEVPAGQQGEILFRTTQFAERYVNDERNTKKTFLPHGWIRLGDIGMINHKGVLFIFGRQKFAILYGASIVYPDQLELRIKQCPGVANVLITGVPDEQLFEEICALIIPEAGTNLTVETVREFCKNELFLNTENMDMNPMPKYFVLVDAFPILPSGKLDRGSAKAMACDLLKLK